VQVVYQAHDAPEKEWRGFFTADDTEDSIEKRARGVLGIMGCWRRLAYWRDANGIRIAMTNRKKEVIMRYHTELDPTIKELPISEDETPATALLKLKVGQNFHLVDNHRVLFAANDSLFGYCSVIENPPIELIHGSVPHSRKARELTKKKDGRIKLEIRYGDERAIFARGVQKTYAKVAADAKDYWSIADPVHISCVRAEDDRIIVECATGIDAPWFTEKACPPLELEKDRIYQDAAKGQVGGWGTAPQQAPMMTRARQAAVRIKKVVDVIFQNLDSGETWKIGGTDSYDEALKMAKNSGKVPKGYNVAISEVNEKRIIVVCQKGRIVSGEVPKPAVTPSKPKPKAKKILPEKLVGKNPEAAFAPKQPPPEVPGTIGTAIDPVAFKRCRPRDIDPAVGSFNRKMEIIRWPRKEIYVRKDANFIEILAETFRDVDLEEDDRITLVLKPPRFEDGAVFLIEKTSLRSRIALEIPIWKIGRAHV
jgi:hypothetical protein